MKLKRSGGWWLVFIVNWHQLESSGKSKSLLKYCLNQISLWLYVLEISFIDEWCEMVQFTVCITRQLGLRNIEKLAEQHPLSGTHMSNKLENIQDLMLKHILFAYYHFNLNFHASILNCCIYHCFLMQ